MNPERWSERDETWYRFGEACVILVAVLALLAVSVGML